MEAAWRCALPPHSKMKQQQRFIIALVASAAVLILWNYVFPPPKPQPPNANVNANANASPSNSPIASATGQPQAIAKPNSPGASTPVPAADNVPERKLRIVTPLYDATFDTRGGIATSWIIKKNKKNGRDVYAAGSS